MCLSLLLVTGCRAQTEKESSSITGRDTATEPKVSWKVNKQYDDKGNIIGYDSTYTWSYTGKQGQAAFVSVDSVMGAFSRQFQVVFPGMFNNSFGGPVWGDSLFYNDFLQPDYFMKKYQGDYFDMEKMMKSMDSMKNNFLRRHYPEIREENRRL